MIVDLVQVKEGKEECVNPRKLHHYLKRYHNDMYTSMQEVFTLIGLNTVNKVVNSWIVGLGGVNSCIVDPKVVFHHLLKEPGVVGFAVAHNHPSGNLAASSEDIALTTRLNECGQLLNYTMLDHLIVTPTYDFFSFKEADLIGA